MNFHTESEHYRVTLDGALEGDSSMRIWARHLRKFIFVYTVGILSVLATNTEVLMPKIAQWSIDALAAGDKGYTRYILPFAALLVVQFAGRVLWRQYLGQQTHRVAARMRTLLWDRARYLPRERLQTDLHTGELMSVGTSDIGLARFIFGFTIVLGMDFLFLFVLTIAAMLTVDVRLTLATLITLPAVPYFVDRLSRRENRQHKEAQAALSNLADLVSQAVATQRLQRVSQTHTFWEQKLRTAADEYRNKRLEVVRTSVAFIPLTGVVPIVSYAILLVLGTRQVLAGELSVGAFVAMQSYIFLIQTPMQELGHLVSEWQRARGSFDRLTKTWGEKEAVGLRSGGSALSTSAVTFEARGLSFRYPGAETPAFENLNFKLEAGRRLGVTGPIGSGKSTLCEVLSGLSLAFEGELKLYGRDIREYSHEALRATIAVVPQRPFLFSDTVRNNISLDAGLTEAEIWHWLEVAGVAEDVRALPNGLDTKLGEWGVNLSGGQKQRLTLARALSRRPRLLILDDCLSAVDTVTEEKILAALDRELQQSTLVWVAHRPSTLRHCTDFIELGGEE